jgi:metal-responsive CopG/Arc/MetJ family transcriptional regulator
MQSTEYTSVKIPKVLADRINQVAGQMGYRSVSEFVLDSTRRRLEQLSLKN